MDSLGQLPSNQKTGEIAALAQLQVELERAVLEAEQVLEAAKRRLAYVQETALPEALLAAGTSGIFLPDGSRVEIETIYHASISIEWPEEKREAAFKVLEARRAGSLINHAVTVIFNRGEGDRARKLVGTLRNHFTNQKVTDHETVHWRRLTAWIKEQLQAGVEDLPLEALGAYVRRSTKITLPSKNGP